MKSYYLNIGALLSGGMIFLAGCRSEQPNPIDMASDAPHLSFTISLSSEAQGSRAGSDVSPSDPDPGTLWGEQDEDHTDYGTDFDRKINSVTPVIYSVNQDGKLNYSDPVGTMSDVECTVANSGGMLTISGKLDTECTPKELEEGNYRLGVFINSPKIDITNPGESIFEDHGTPLTFSGIPMYGVGNAVFKGLEEAMTAHLPFEIKENESSDALLDIPLLRAMAKVRVKVAKSLFSDRDMKLKDISISRHASAGHIVPAKWDEVTSMTKLHTAESMNAIKEEALDKYTYGCKATPVIEEDSYDKNSWTMLRFYMPETYNCFHDDLESPEICLTVEYTCDGNDDDIKRHKIYFKRYNNGVLDKDSEPWDIIRNHIYEFYITGIEPLNGSLLISVNTDWWDEHKLVL